MSIGHMLRWIACLLLVVSCSCRSSPNAEPAAPTPTVERSDTTPFNVLIVVLDACRADKLGCYGLGRESSPNIDAFAADPDAVIFRRHHVQGAWTKPSTASLFSGLYVHQHGVVMAHEPAADSGPITHRFRTHMLSADIDTMGERFRGLGFATLGVANNDLLIEAGGITQGFDAWHPPQELHGGDPKFVATLVDMIRKTPGRFFGYVHLNACHYPFPAFKRDAEYMQRYGFAYDEAARQAAGIDFAAAGFAVRDGIRERTLQPTPDDIRFVHLLYESKLRRVDRGAFGPLIRGLHDADRYDDTLIIVTADHGEELCDHNGYAHGHALWEEVIHVPLIVKFPKGRRPQGLGREVTALTSSIDLLPSLMALIGHPLAEPLPGALALQGKFNPYALAELGDRPDWAFLQGDYKLIEMSGGPALFNLRDDPHERHNLAAGDPDRVQAMRATAQEVIKASGAAVTAPVVEQELAPDVIERMRELGYVK